MEQYNDYHKKTSVQKSALTNASAHGRKPVYLQDNRPQSIVQKKLLEGVTRPGSIVQRQEALHLRSAGNSVHVVQLARTKTVPRKTISGHGRLRRHNNKLKYYTVPHGKTIMRPAPPGATLGNLSMLLSEKKGLSRAKLLKQMKVSTTGELWNNLQVVKIIKGKKSIPKTPTQAKSLEKLLSGIKLTGPEKSSLARMESRPEFEKWVSSYVKSQTFKTFKGGESMYDMSFTKFEDHLKSATPHDQNEYVSAPGTLSGYVNANPGESHFMVNACSYDENAPYTGFQIDQI